jgi:hypothetical protein
MLGTETGRRHRPYLSRGLLDVTPTTLCVLCPALRIDWGVNLVQDFERKT